MKWIYLYPVFLFFASCTAVGQSTARTIYQTFQIGDSVQLIEFDLIDSVSVRSWPGSNILVETRIAFTEGGNTQILEYFIDEGRYSLGLDTIGATVRLKAIQPNRQELHFRNEVIREWVLIKLSIPDTFRAESPAIYRRKEK